MFGFGEVRTHLGVVFGDACGLFWVFSWIYEQRDEINKIWANYKVLRYGVGIPRNSVGPRRGVACPRRGVVEREDLASLGCYAAAKAYIST